MSGEFCNKSSIFHILHWHSVCLPKDSSYHFSHLGMNPEEMTGCQHKAGALICVVWCTFVVSILLYANI